MGEEKDMELIFDGVGTMLWIGFAEGGTNRSLSNAYVYTVSEGDDYVLMDFRSTGDQIVGCTIHDFRRKSFEIVKKAMRKDGENLPVKRLISMPAIIRVYRLSDGFFHIELFDPGYGERLNSSRAVTICINSVVDGSKEAYQILKPISQGPAKSDELYITLGFNQMSSHMPTTKSSRYWLS